MTEQQRHHRIIGFLLGLLFVLALLLYLSLTQPGWLAKTLETGSSVEVVYRDEQPDTDYLHEEEVVMVDVTGKQPEALPIDRVLFEYVEVVDSCGPHYEGECLNVRSGPGTDYPSVAKLRTGMVLKVGGKVEREEEETGITGTWYKIVFDEWLRYPGRVTDDWYVAADYVEVLLNEGERTSWEHGTATTTKRIEVDRSEQKIFAYDGDALFMEADISTGLALTPTPRGTFHVFKKTPSRYMQGPLPLPGSDYYDLPGVPWNLYFTTGGAVIHGAYWHNSFGSRYSHGCVNLPPSTAEELYHWAELGMPVIVRD